MAGSLVLLDSATASNSATISLGASNWDTSFDVYKVVLNNVTSASTGSYYSLFARVLTSGSAQDDSNYDNAHKGLWSGGSFQNVSYVNQTAWSISGTGMDSNSTNESFNGTLYLFNFNSASEYSFITLEATLVNADGQLYGFQGGNCKTTTEANNGIQFFYSSDNIETGNFKLFGLRK